MKLADDELEVMREALNEGILAREKATRELGAIDGDDKRICLEVDNNIIATMKKVLKRVDHAISKDFDRWYAELEGKIREKKGVTAYDK